MRGGADVEVEVVETDRGPLVLDGLSIRFPARVASDVGFSCLLPLLRARTAADVVAALRGWVDPVNRVLTADADGTVLSLDAGLVVTRAPRDRRLPHDAWSDAARPAPWHRLADADRGHRRRGRRQRAARPTPRVTSAARTWRRTGRGGSGTLLDGGGPLRARGHGRDPRRHPAGQRRRAAGWVRRADGLSPAAVALRDRLLAWDRHMDAESADAGAFAAWRTEVALLLAAHPALAPLHAPHGRGVLLDPWLGVGPRVADSLAAAARRDRAGGSTGTRWPARRWNGSRCTARNEPWGDRHRLHPVPTLLGLPRPGGRADPALRRHRLRPLHGERARRERRVVARLGRAVGVGPRATATGAGGACRSVRRATRRARTRPTS